MVVSFIEHLSTNNILALALQGGCIGVTYIAVKLKRI